MAEKIDGGVLLEAIRDGHARLATEKQVAGLADAVKSMVAQNEERWASVERRLKAIDAKMDEISETDRKTLLKLRDELTEAIENIEVSGGEGGDETSKMVKDGLDELKGFVKLIVGDDPKTLEAVRDRFRGWVKGGGKAAAKAINDAD